MSGELPILAAGSVVRAILSGAQTQDRRPIKALAPLADGSPSYPQYRLREMESDHRGALLHVHNGEGAGLWLSAPWSPGDGLYVRETWRSVGWRPENGHWIEYAADNRKVWREAPADTLSMDVVDHMRPDRWRPSIHMPKWAARIRLRVLSVGVERVGEISEADAEAEGINPECVGSCGRTGEGCGVCALSLPQHFGRLWDSLYGRDPALTFAASPWVWVTKFERVLP